jgi:hypothetical protein
VSARSRRAFRLQSSGKVAMDSPAAVTETATAGSMASATSTDALDIESALTALPSRVLLLVGLPEFWSWKSHVILAAGFREAVPGRELSGRALAVLIAVSCIVFILINATTRSPHGITEVFWLHWFRECIGTAITFSIPALVAPAWLVSRALPNRPALTGALCGLGVASWLTRFCGYFVGMATTCTSW